jgi:hypothetical protein
VAATLSFREFLRVAVAIRDRRFHGGIYPSPARSSWLSFDGVGEGDLARRFNCRLAGCSPPATGDFEDAVRPAHFGEVDLDALRPEPAIGLAAWRRLAASAGDEAAFDPGGGSAQDRPQ